MSKNNKKAFTIIEVVLVLAIAGLIILGVFIALPALQRSKRNTIRKDDMARIMKAVTAYQTAHSGKSPMYRDESKCQSGGGWGDKGCYGIDEKFFTKYIDAGLSIDMGRTGNQGGYQYFFTCTSGDCSDFTDPEGYIYSIKAEGQYYSKESRQDLNNHGEDNNITVIHLAPYSKCNTDWDPAQFTRDDIDPPITLDYAEKKGLGITLPTNNFNDTTIVFSQEGNNAFFCIDNQ